MSQPVDRGRGGAPSGPVSRARRQFLQIGAAGITGAVAAGGGSLLAGDGQNAPPQAPPSPPSADGVIDPAAVRSETWTEPWIWRPADWPGQALDLNVVERNEPDTAPSPGQIFPGQFSFGGISPAPTIRVRGDGTIRIRLRNLLGADFGRMWIGPCPDPGGLTPEILLAFQCHLAKAEGRACQDKPNPAFNPFAHLDELGRFLGVKLMDGHCLSGVSNSEHGSRVTNLHTHGLHVRPGPNPGAATESDHVRVRLLSKDDWAMRQRMSGGCAGLAPHEYVGHVDYEFALGAARSGPGAGAHHQPPPHPPGTHWYHPHAHGSTHDQVSAGMAGFLVVEGDVDEAINTVMTGTPHPDPSVPAGAYDYRERLLFIQRVVIPSVDFNAPGSRRQRLLPAPVPPEGVPSPTVMFMRPGAVERWRVLNGSVDGRGFKRVMVLDGQFVYRNNALWRVERDSATRARRLTPVTRAQIEAAKLPLYQLAFDGMTLVTVENGRARHTIKDLSRRNAGSSHPLCRPPDAGESEAEAMLRNVEACFTDGDSIRRAFVRPNEIWMATANRADVFFKAPLDSLGRVFTVLAQEEVLHTDNFQARLQRLAEGKGGPGFGGGNPPPFDVVVAYVHVRSAAVPGGDFDVLSLRDHLPPVPPALHPIGDDETRMTAAEARARGAAPGSHRTRVLGYSGYGSGAFPVIEVPDAYATAHPELRDLTWTERDGTRILLPPNGRTMAINAHMDLAKTPVPPAPRKYAPGEPDRYRMLVDTAEEWVLYNTSPTLWGHTDVKRFPQRGAPPGQFRAYAVRRAQGQSRFWRDREFQIVTNGADHPFHIHVNPMWVTRIEVPDEQGRLHNLLDEPRWMDTVSIPRNGGRVVFRSRFSDYTGTWIHHCHILMHEDMGMMQEVECVASPAASNATPRAAVASHSMTDAEVDAIYPRPSMEIGYRQGLTFVDPNPGTGQVFPGFEIEVPRLADS